ncbi:MAG: hypothetical protein JO061_10820 [Acidobacteriaceae bacterium]|nr:hypothetical protein [Acidobacteriaceae bacterium]
MTLTIKLSEEQATTLEAKAAAEGLSVEEWIKKLAEPARATGRPPGRKSLVEVFAPLRGMNLDFSRNKSTSRPVDLA